VIDDASYKAVALLIAVFALIALALPQAAHGAIGSARLHRSQQGRVVVREVPDLAEVWPHTEGAGVTERVAPAEARNGVAALIAGQGLRTGRRRHSAAGQILALPGATRVLTVARADHVPALHVPGLTELAIQQDQRRPDQLRPQRGKRSARITCLEGLVASVGCAQLACRNTAGRPSSPGCR
jgi:hypothetical protein